MRRKGTNVSDFLLYFMVRLPIIIVMFVVLAITINRFTGLSLETWDLDSKILSKRLLYSDNLLAYKDPDTGRTYPGIIDASKIDTGRLENELLQQETRYAAIIKVRRLNDGTIFSAYINEEQAKSWEDYTYDDAFGFVLTKIPVKIYDHGEIADGIISLKVIRKDA